MMGFRIVGVILGSESFRLEGFRFLDFEAFSQFVDQLDFDGKGLFF